MGHGTMHGRDVQEIKDMLIASAISGVHGLVIGNPGGGKTTAAYSFAEQVFGESGRDSWKMFRLDSSTQPETLKGAMNIVAALSDNPKIEYIIEGSVNDPKMKLIVLDEFGRLMDACFEIVQKAMDNWEIELDEAPTFILTANFVPQHERVLACRDRIGLVAWLNPSSQNIRELAREMMKSIHHRPIIGDGIPDWDTIRRVRGFSPGKKATEAVLDVVEELFNECRSSQLSMPNNRRVNYWTKILYRMSAFHHDAEEFDTIPLSAKTALQWASEFTTKEDAEEWKRLVQSIFNPLQTIIDNAKREARLALREANQKAGGDSLKAGVILGRAVADQVILMRKKFQDLGLSENDERIEEFSDECNNWFSALVRGEDIM